MSKEVRVALYRPDLIRTRGDYEWVGEFRLVSICQVHGSRLDVGFKEFEVCLFARSRRPHAPKDDLCVFVDKLVEV